jgi:hypothetical protein
LNIALEKIKTFKEVILRENMERYRSFKGVVNLFKGYHSRKTGIRRPRNTIVIVCEGEKTEITYFEGFRERYSGVQIEPLHGGCTDPINIVKFALDQIEYYDIDFENGDAIWCVFDVDENENRFLSKALKEANKNRLNIALSNPSFEFWYLIHFEKKVAYISRSEAIDELKKYIPKYEKKMNVFPILKPKLQNAIEHAKFLNKQHEKNKIKLFSKESNPSSQVFKLIEYIESIKQMNKTDI